MRTLIASMIAVAITVTVSIASGQAGQAEPQEQRPAEAQPELSGRYVLAQPQQAQQAVDRAIEEAVGEMSFFTRSIARNRLREKNPVRREVEVDVSGDMVTIAYGGDRYRTREGQWATVTATGEQVQLLHQVRGNRIYQTFRTGEGQKLTVYTLSDDGRRLWLDVTVRSPQLPSPLTYRLSYRRVPSDRDEPVAAR